MSAAFERRDLRARTVAFALLGLFAGLLLSGALVAWLLALSRGEEAIPVPTALERREPATPAPRLEIDPGASRAEIEAAAAARLTGYGWSDREAGRARIPIERAKEILATQGWPDDPPGGGEAGSEAGEEPPP